ncbi:TPA: membrane integrity-associated transporter subunit PqiC [Enterobacter chengduensis]|nr:membrane integrity-associated transporter subunit PqiC [Enterobacter chengduensis]HEM8019842.1 membrane integrity-associated transporter subunit PqiC [Enterobacter chengduensis]
MNTSARMIPVAAVTMTLVLGLSACSVLPKAAPMVTYKLPDYHIAKGSTPRAVPGPGALRVYAPESSRVLDSERLFIAQPDGRLSAWQGVRWADPAPVLLRDRIVEAFMRDGRSTSVITDSTPMSADMELRSTLRAFQLEYRGTEAIAAVRLDVQLVDPAKRTAIASRRFEAIQATGSKREADVVSAFGVATDILAGQIVEWAVQVGAARLRVAPELASNHAPTASSISTD